MAMLEAQQLTRLERKALKLAIGNVDGVAQRDALIRQLAETRVKNRTKKTTGYYVDFDVPSGLRMSNLTDDFNKNPPQAEAAHPDGSNALFFIVYVKDGALAFMEAASTADWPDDEDQIVFRE